MSKHPTDPLNKTITRASLPIPAPAASPVQGKHGSDDDGRRASITEAELLNLSRLFRVFDSNDSGFILFEELVDLLRMMGISEEGANADYLREEFGHVLDPDNKHVIEFPSLVDFYIKSWRTMQQRRIITIDEERSHINTVASPRFFAHASWRIAWDILIMLVSLYFCLRVFLEVVWRRGCVDFDAATLGMETIFTVLLLTDIFVQCNTLAYDEDSRLVEDLADIALAYATSWLIPDILAAFPSDLLIVAAFPEGHCQMAVFLFFRSLRLLRAVRVFMTLFVDLHVPGLFTPELIFFAYRVAPVLRASFFLTFGFHVLTCLWLEISTANGNEPISSHVVDSNGNSTTSSVRATYVDGLYLVTMTLTTVGYGDIQTRTEAERCYLIFLMVVAILFNGVVIAQVSVFLTQSDLSRYRKERMRQTASVLDHFKVSPHMQSEILSFQSHVLNQNLSNEHRDLVSNLPPVMIEKVALRMRLRIVELVPQFAAALPDVKVALASSLQNAVFTPNQFIVVAGEIGDTMYFLSFGVADVLLPSGETIATLRKGNFFGEIALMSLMVSLSDQVRRTASVKALTYCDVFCLRRREFLQLLAKYKSLRTSIENTMRERLEEYENKTDTNVKRSIFLPRAQRPGWRELVLFQQSLGNPAALAVPTTTNLPPASPTSTTIGAVPVTPAGAEILVPPAQLKLHTLRGEGSPRRLDEQEDDNESAAFAAAAAAEDQASLTNNNVNMDGTISRNNNAANNNANITSIRDDGIPQLAPSSVHRSPSLTSSPLGVLPQQQQQPQQPKPDADLDEQPSDAIGGGGTSSLPPPIRNIPRRDTLQPGAADAWAAAASSSARGTGTPSSGRVSNASSKQRRGSQQQDAGGGGNQATRPKQQQQTIQQQPAQPGQQKPQPLSSSMVLGNEPIAPTASALANLDNHQLGVNSNPAAPTPSAGGGSVFRLPMHSLDVSEFQGSVAGDSLASPYQAASIGSPVTLRVLERLRTVADRARIQSAQSPTSVLARQQQQQQQITAAEQQQRQPQGASGGSTASVSSTSGFPPVAMTTQQSQANAVVDASPLLAASVRRAFPPPSSPVPGNASTVSLAGSQQPTPALPPAPAAAVADAADGNNAMISPLSYGFKSANVAVASSGAGSAAAGGGSGGNVNDAFSTVPSTRLGVTDVVTLLRQQNEERKRREETEDLLQRTQTAEIVRALQIQQQRHHRHHHQQQAQAAQSSVPRDNDNINDDESGSGSGSSTCTSLVSSRKNSVRGASAERAGSETALQPQPPQQQPHQQQQQQQNPPARPEVKEEYIKKTNKE